MDSQEFQFKPTDFDLGEEVPDNESLPTLQLNGEASPLLSLAPSARPLIESEPICAPSRGDSSPSAGSISPCSSLHSDFGWSCGSDSPISPSASSSTSPIGVDAPTAAGEADLEEMTPIGGDERPALKSPSSTDCKSHKKAVKMPQRKGGMQLWQYLYALLSEPDEYRDLIEWTQNVDKREFRLNEPEAIAVWWGEHKAKKNMSYDKLSRSLRYYYDKGLIRKISGERYVYRFCVDPEVMYQHIGIRKSTRPKLRKQSPQVEQAKYKNRTLGFPPHSSYPQIVPPPCSFNHCVPPPLPPVTHVPPVPYFINNGCAYAYTHREFDFSASPLPLMPSVHCNSPPLNLPPPPPYSPQPPYYCPTMNDSAAHFSPQHSPIPDFLSSESDFYHLSTEDTSSDFFRAVTPYPASERYWTN